MKRTLLYLIAAIILPQTIIAAVLVGKTEGSFSVSPSGAATYTIPIKIQQGLSDFVPSISLSYNSQASNGIAGIGWNISGLSTISAVPKSVYFDGQAKAIEEGEDNAYNLDGMRLLLKSGNNGQTGATYRTENEQYNIIKITASSNGTPATFQVKSTDGTTYMYGSSSGRHTLSNGKSYQWALDYAEDVLGNYIQYSYSQEGILYPTSITYGRNTHGMAGVDCTILFNYENRTDSISTYILGEQHYFKKRLKSIVCKYSGNTYRTYTLNYSEDTFSHLTSVTESGTSSSSLPPTTFEWEIPAEFQIGCNSRSLELYDQTDNDDVYFFSADLDGDGISEIISVKKVSLELSETTTNFHVGKWNPWTRTFDWISHYHEQTFWIDMLNTCVSIHADHKTGNSLVFPYFSTFPSLSEYVTNQMVFVFLGVLV